MNPYAINNPFHPIVKHILLFTVIKSSSIINQYSLIIPLLTYIYFY